MKCDTAFGIRRVTWLFEAEILHLWTRFMKLKNNSIVAEHGLSLEITQSPGGSSDTSEGYKDPTESTGALVRYSPSANYLLLTDNGESNSYSEALSSKESVQWKKAINKEIISLEKNQTCSLVRISARKKASQRLWMFKVKEEQNCRKRYKARFVVKGFQQKQRLDYNEIFSPVVKMTTISWAGRKPRVQIEGNYVRTDSSTKTMVDDILVAGSDMAEFNKPKVIIFVEDSWNEEPCRDVHQVGDEREVKVLRSFNWPPSELITEDVVLPKRGYS
ncbi:retrovirus-related pol polyprotein from transposon TNT 1-94 [Tanacetum coccineum]